MYINTQLLASALLVVLVNVYFWAFRRRDLRKWPPEVKWMLYLSWPLLLLALVAAFLPLPT